VTTLERPPYSPDPAAGDFYLFPQLKPALKGRCFCDATDKECNGRAEKIFTKWFPEIFPTPLQSLAEMYICTRGLA
jgi:hypothetical protein